MARKYYDVFQTEVENSSGYMVEGLEAQCECGEKVYTIGTSEGAERRCAVLLRDKCTEGKHYYVIRPTYYPK